MKDEELDDEYDEEDDDDFGPDEDRKVSKHKKRLHKQRGT